MSDQCIETGFMVIHGNQPELLRQLLVHWFRAHPLEPLEDEVILVQSNGIAQWLKLALAARASDDPGSGCGIAAALEMLLPSRFMWQVYRSVLGQDAVPDVSPFDKPRLIWRLMRLLPELIDQPGYEPLSSFLWDDAEWRKRYQLAERIADIFDQYQVYRADWLEAWARGEDVLLDGQQRARPLDTAQRWQAQLWRALLQDVGTQHDTSRAAIHRRFLAQAAGLAARPAGLPRRVSVFGLSSLPRQSLEALLAISRFTQVILCVHNPCEHYWGNLLSVRDHARRTSGRHARRQNAPEVLDEADLHLHAHPLLAAWGKQGRDYIALLDELDAPENYRGRFEQVGEKIDIFHSHGEDSLLHQLQEDIRQLRPLAETRTLWPPVDPAHDRSIRFHIAHSPQREVEILHDQLLAAFNADPHLRPRDIVVMVPDINAYAPHIQAVFGLIEPGDPRHIPFSMTDVATRQQAPMAFALSFLLGLPESRLAVSDLLDLLEVPAIRQRFGIEVHDLPLLHRWIDQTRIRWGLDASHRAQFIGPGQAQNTWMQGLRRMLLGYAVGSDPDGREDQDWQEIEPYGDVAGLDAALVGPLCRLLQHLEAVARGFAEPAPPAVWQQRLQDLLRDFFRVDTPEDTLLLLQWQASLQAWVEACAQGGLDDPLPLAVIRDHWLASAEPGGLSQRFMAGRVTFATLMPMRAIPFRMVCLLGMNDGEFPRSRPPVDFDLMARDSRPGDRSRREDDRYLFLEALLSARERLHVSWVGKSIHDNANRPPSVLVSQLRDHLESGWRLADGSPAPTLLAALTVEHRLQPFNPDYFSGDSDAAHFTYAREWEAGITASRPASTEHALPPPRLTAPVGLASLAAFLKDPVRSFHHDRLRVHLEEEDPTSEDQEPFALDGLAQWSLHDQLIRARLDALHRGEDEARAVDRQLARIRRRGELPLGRAADLQAEALLAPLDRMFTAYREALGRWPNRREDAAWVHHHEAAGQTIAVQGRLTHHYDDGNDLCRIELIASDLLAADGRYRREKLLGAWLQHLAAHLGGQAITTRLIGRNGQALIRPLEIDLARRHFGKILETYLEGLRAPLPFAPATGFAWLEKGGTPFSGPLAECGQAAVQAARSRYQDGYQHPGECTRSPYLQRAYPSFERLWSDGRFTQFCADLYAPLLAAVGEDETPD